MSRGVFYFLLFGIFRLTSTSAHTGGYVTGQKGYSVELILEKIDRCLLFSNGIFLKSAVTGGRRGKESLNQFMRKHPGCFNTILTEGTSLIQVTQIYSSIRKIEKIVPQIDSSTELIQSIIWSAFILQNRIERSLTTNEFSFMGRQAILDDLDSKYDGYQGLVITAPFRIASLNTLHYIPTCMSSKWSERIVEALRSMRSHSANNVSNDDDSPINYENIIDGGLWPEDEFECHVDKRKYPSIEDELTGLEKWKYDQFLLSNGGPLPSGYRLGVYQL